jgi:hypothetical protein
MRKPRADRVSRERHFSTVVLIRERFPCDAPLARCCGRPNRKRLHSCRIAALFASLTLSRNPLLRAYRKPSPVRWRALQT